MKGKTPREFYEEVGLKNVLDRRSNAETKKEISYLKKFLSKEKRIRILDAACGTGRISLPLAEAGYNISGIDISPNLLGYAKKEALQKKLKINFVEGDIRALTFEDESFECILCLWSSFNEIYDLHDQIKTICEMKRVLCDGGKVLIEMAKPERHAKDFIKGNLNLIRKIGNVNYFRAYGIETMPGYSHNEKTLSNVMELSGVKNYRIFFDEFGGRERMLLQFNK